MHLPIRAQGDVSGVFCVGYEAPHAFSDDEQRLFQALAQRAAIAIENDRLYELGQRNAVLEERSRLARDLHDAVTQNLFSASLIAEALPAIWEANRAEGADLLRELRQLSRGALAEMRTLLLELRPAALADAALPDLLRQLAEAASGRMGAPVTVTVTGRCDLLEPVRINLYRIAQEALNNAVKHSHATEVSVSLACRDANGDSHAELTISDNGCGFDLDNTPPDHLGLEIIRERAQEIGATLHIASRPGAGATVSVCWPGAP
jgi:signal transduction histidine kinase